MLWIEQPEELVVRFIDKDKDKPNDGDDKPNCAAFFQPIDDPVRPKDK